MNIEAEKLREAAYWRERLNILRAANAKMSAQTYKEVEAAFNLAQRDIQRDIDAWLTRVAKNNGIVDMAAARRLLDAGELKEFKWDVNEYIRHGKENAVSGKWTKQLENASARVHISRLEALKIQTQNHLETAFAVENNAVEGLAKDVYKSGYYRTVYEMQKGTGIGFDIAGLDTKRLDAVAHKPWSLDARTFSDRIWGQKDKMVGALHQEIIRNCIYGRSQKDAAKALEQYVKKDVKNAEYCARRVIVTETAYFSALSQRDGLLELDCEWYEIDLPIDARSCPLCRDMNGRHFKISEFEVGATAPPFHPYCANGAIIPYFDDDFDVDTSEREGAREISEDVSYEKWQQEFIDDGLTTGENGGTIKGKRAVVEDSLGIKHHARRAGKIDISNEDEVKSLVSRFENKYADSDIEHCLLIRPDGEVYMARGSDVGVDTIALLGEKSKGCYTTHNHPRHRTQYTFSGQDFECAVLCGEKRMRAVDFKYEYEAIFPDKPITLDEFYDAYGSAENDKHRLFDASGLDLSEYVENNSHVVIEEMCRILGITYTRRKRNE